MTSEEEADAPFVVPVTHEAWLMALLHDLARLDEFLRLHLPGKMVAQFADSLPEPLPERHVTPTLRQRVSDQVYCLKLKKRKGVRPELLVNVEHQSTIDPTMALRTNEYQAPAMRRWAVRNPDLVPPVIVLVTYHGAKKWDAKLSVEELTRATGAIAAAQTRHRYFVCDLAQMQESERARDPVLRAGLTMLVRAYQGGLTVDEIARLLKPFPSGSQLERMAFAYMMNLCDSEETLLEGIARAKSNKGVNVMESVAEKLLRRGREEGEASVRAEMESVAEKLLRRGREEGREEGEAEGRVRMLLLMLKGRFGELPATVVSKVKAATPEQLETWAAELHDSKRAESLFRGWAGNGRSPAH